MPYGSGKNIALRVQKTTIAAGYYILTINMYVLEKLNMLRMSYGRINMVLCFCSAFCYILHV